MRSAADTRADLVPVLRDVLGPDRLSMPGDGAYADTCRLWNGAVHTRPALVVRPTTSEEISLAVKAARRFDVPLSVRSGGHDWAGRSLRQDALTLDLADLREVRIEGTEAVVGGGARAGDVVAAAAPHALNVVTGTAGGVGMAGLSTGGGYGPLLGTAGLAADNLLAAEVVLADGRIVSTQDEPELLWALRGGGGNFGVVASMRLRLHRDQGLVGGTVIFPWAQARSVLAGYARLCRASTDGLTVLVELTHVPDVGAAVMAVPVWSGDPAGAQRAIDDVLAWGDPLNAAVGPVSQVDLLATFDAFITDGTHWTMRTRNVAELTPEITDLVVRAAQDRPGPLAYVGLRQFHGVATQTAPGATAFGQRGRHLAVEISAGHAPDEDGRPLERWASTLWADLAPNALPGGYPNFLHAEQTDQVAQAYGPGAARLLAAKATYDPHGAFTATPLPGLDGR